MIGRETKINIERDDGENGWNSSKFGKLVTINCIFFFYIYILSIITFFLNV